MSDFALQPQPPQLTAEQFAAVFPFYFVVGSDLRVRQAGGALVKQCKDFSPGAALPDLIRVLQPEGEITFNGIVKNQRQIFLIEHPGTGLRLRGQMLPVDAGKAVVFLGSPALTEAAQPEARSNALEDIQQPTEPVAKLEAELRSANERLRQHEREQSKFALIVARTNNGVVLTNAKGQVEWLNEGFTRLTGYTLEDMLGKTPGSVLQGPETNPATIQRIRDQLQKGEGFSLEILNYTKRKEKYWVAIEVQPIRNAAGQITNYMAIESDITERAKAESQLRSTNALQRAILQGAGHAIIYCDSQGIIQLFNPAAERMLGYFAAEIVGKETPAIFHAPDEIIVRAKELTVDLGREVKSGFETFTAKAELGQSDEREWTYIRKDGTRFPVLLSVTVMFDDQGQITGYLGIASDLTLRKRDEEKLRAMLAELERFNRVMMNREERVVELKREINQLLAATGRPAAYPSISETSFGDSPKTKPEKTN